MDKQLLQALDNLSFALERISETLNKKDSKSSTGKAMESGNFGGQLKEISNGINKLLADNQKILKNQNTIIALSKKKESDKKTGVLEGDKSKESSIKKGVGTILLIAVAVLAIGMAFKLVGNVDFLSVVGLALAMTLISIAFEKIAKLKISTKDALNTSYVLVIIAGVIAVSSWILALVMPLSFGKALTAILIAGVFTVLSYGMKNIITALKGVNIFTLVKTMEYLPFIFLALSTAIALSSYVLALVMPLSFSKAITAILIAAVFAVISYGLKNIMTAFKGVNIIDIFAVAEFIPMIFLSLSTAIALSSYVLALVMPIGLGQAITAILIAAVFAVISYGLKNIMKSFEGISVDSIAEAIVAIPFIFIGLSFAIAASSWLLSMVVPITFAQALTSIAISIVFVVLSFAASLIFKAIGGISNSKLIAASIIMPILFTAMSLAIMASSYLLAQTQEIPFMKLLSILGLAITVAIAAVVMGLAAIILNKLGGISDYIKGGIAIVIIAATIMASSLILSYGTYEEGGYPKWEWALGVGLSLAVFGIAAVLLGTQALNPFFYAGLGVTLLVAATIVAASAILSLGSYADGAYPSLSWTLGVGGSIAAFGIAAVLLGFQVFNPFFYMGLGVILVVAATIVATSLVFAEGKFDENKFPSMKWMLGATGTILTMSLVAVAIAFLSPLIILGSIAIMAVALTIMLVDKAFSEGKFKSYPSDKWMMGATKTILQVGLAAVGLAFFLPLIVLGSLAILATALTIMLVDEIFSEGSFKSYPSKQWIDGVSETLIKWTGLMDSISFGSVVGGAISDFFGGGLTDVAESIVSVDNILKVGDFKSYPTKQWIDGVGVSLMSMSMIMDSDLEVNEDVLGVADMLVLIAAKIKENAAVFNSTINPGFMKSIASNITSYVELAKYVAGNYPGQKGGLVGAVQGMLFGAESTEDPMDRVVNGMVKLGNAYVKLSQSIQNFGNAINAIDAEKLSAIKSFTSNVILMSLMDPDMFDDMLSKLEDKAGVFVDAINEIDAKPEDAKKPASVNAGKGAKAAPDPNQQKMIQLLAAMDAKLGTIAKNSGTLADYTNELRTSSGVKVKK